VQLAVLLYISHFNKYYVSGFCTSRDFVLFGIMGSERDWNTNDLLFNFTIRAKIGQMGRPNGQSERRSTFE
jgi:hypothetical protein